ncbi:unnamed protein product [Closterium sp. NIES-64]|nr:unnamed protein product [Closterium sp. NIES-64]
MREACGKRGGRVVWLAGENALARALAVALHTLCAWALSVLPGRLRPREEGAAMEKGKGAWAEWAAQMHGALARHHHVRGRLLRRLPLASFNPAPLLSSRLNLAPSPPATVTPAASRCPSPSPCSAAAEGAAEALICAARLAEEEARGSDTSTPTGWRGPATPIACFADSSVLLSIGLSYYPSKHWASVIPAFLIVTVVCALLLYSGVNRLSVQPASSKFSIHDNFARMQPPMTHTISQPISQPPRQPSHSPSPLPSTLDPPSTVSARNIQSGYWNNEEEGVLRQSGSTRYHGMRLYRSPSEQDAMLLSRRAPIPPIHDLPITLVNDLLYG